MITWKNGENKPDFGEFSISMNPEKQTTGGKGQLLSWAFFVKGTNIRKVHISIHASVALTAIPSLKFYKHYQRPFPTLSSTHQRTNAADKQAKQIEQLIKTNPSKSYK